MRRQRAAVTGAGRGIGRAIADRLEADGMDVVRLDIAGDGVVRCDVTDAAAVAEVAREAGPVDVLVNNAGIWRYDSLATVSPRDFSDVVDVNLRGAFHCTQSFGRGMLERQRGSIVNIVSISAVVPSPAVGAYGPTKAALVALTRQTAVDWGPRGVRCNAVGPGQIRTPGTEEAFAEQEKARARAAAVPLGRLGEPEDVAEVVAFFASDRSAYVTGQVLYVDGGLTHALMGLLPYAATGDGERSA